MTSKGTQRIPSILRSWGLGVAVAVVGISVLISLTLIEANLANRYGLPQFILVVFLVITWVIPLYYGFALARVIQPQKAEFSDFLTAASIIVAVYLAFATLQEQQKFEIRKEEQGTPQLSAVVEQLPREIRDRLAEDFENYRELFDAERHGLSKGACLLKVENDSATAVARDLRLRVRLDPPSSKYGFACIECSGEAPSYRAEELAVGGLPTMMLLEFTKMERKTIFSIVLGVASPRAPRTNIEITGGSENKGQFSVRGECP